jgi:ABC-type nitrate/sulfonate/bicarbonate transport system substrate-binding protein
MQIAYRDADRTPLLYLLRDTAQRHEDLEIELIQVKSGAEYESRFLAGELEIICEHLRFLFPARLAGHPVRCLAACQNHSSDVLLARDGIPSLFDLRGRTIAIRGTESSRISSEYWLRHLDLADHVQTLIVDDAQIGRWQQWRMVTAGDADAVICSPLYQAAAITAGLHVLDAPPLPEIGSLFFAALAPFVESHHDSLRRLMRALYRALFVIHHDRDAALDVMAREPARLMGLSATTDIELRLDEIRAGLDERPIPRLAALTTTFAMLNESYASLANLEPMLLWDLRYVQELEEQRFAEQLAGEAGPPSAGRV